MIFEYTYTENEDIYAPFYSKCKTNVSLLPMCEGSVSVLGWILQEWNNFYPWSWQSSDYKLANHYSTKNLQMCPTTCQLHEISISSVSVLKQHIHGTEINQVFHIQVQDICTNAQRIYKIPLYSCDQWILGQQTLPVLAILQPVRQAALLLPGQGAWLVAQEGEYTALYLPRLFQG